MMKTIALIGSMAGAWLIAKQRREAFLVWLVANAIWLIDSASRGDIQQSILWVYYSIMCIVGLTSWRKNDTNN